MRCPGDGHTCDRDINSGLTCSAPKPEEVATNGDKECVKPPAYDGDATREVTIVTKVRYYGRPENAAGIIKRAAREMFLQFDQNMISCEEVANEEATSRPSTPEQPSGGS